MLASVAAARPNRRMILVVSGERGARAPYRYRRAICIPSLLTRRGINRFVNYFIVIHLLWTLQRRRRSYRGRLLAYVRNDPLLLAGAATVRGLYCRLTFQGSHPHEKLDPNPAKRALARWIYKASSKQVDAILAVSPAGVERLYDLFPKAKAADFIPLLAEPIPVNRKSKPTIDNGPLRIIYIGSHRPIRQIEVVLQGVADAVLAGAKLHFHSVGAAAADVERLRAMPEIAHLESQGTLIFTPKVPRPNVPKLLSQADIGSCLVAPHPEFREMSPTKLAEYFSEGLAVIASRGIPMQETFVSNSDAGLVIDWSRHSIAKSLTRLESDRSLVNDMKINALNFARDHLQYSKYVDKFDLVTGLTSHPDPAH